MSRVAVANRRVRRGDFWECFLICFPSHHSHEGSTQPRVRSTGKTDSRPGFEF
jgi:hypothetical protein